MKSLWLYLCVSIMPILAGTINAANWPSWRGPNGDNTSPESVFPVEWSKDRNVGWRVDLPDRGNSSPIVWGDRVFITQATDKDSRREIMCFRRSDGKLLWHSGTVYAEKETTHEANTHCAASPVTDGTHVIASFASAGIFCYDLEGKELWHTDLGKQSHIWGQGSSPIIHGDLCIVFHGPGEKSAVYALDKSSGRIRWQVALPQIQPRERFDGFAGKSDAEMGSFATPSVIHSGSRDELLLALPNVLQAFDPKTGHSLWTCDGLNPLIYASPTFGDGLIVEMGGFFGGTIFVKPGGEGDITSTRRVWHEQRAKKHRIGSPIIKSGYIYLSNTIGVAECIELATGKTVWEERLAATGPNGETWASMVLADDKLYVVNQSGDTIVVRASPRFQLIATNPVGEISNATLALSDGDIFLRTHKALWCIRDSKPVATAR